MVRPMMIAFAIGAIPSTLWLTMEQWQPKETMYFGTPDDFVCVGLADFDNALVASRELEQSGIHCHIGGDMLMGISVAEEDVAGPRRFWLGWKANSTLKSSTPKVSAIERARSTTNHGDVSKSVRSWMAQFASQTGFTRGSHFSRYSR